MCRRRVFSRHHFIKTLQACENAELISVEVRINIISEGKGKSIRIMKMWKLTSLGKEFLKCGAEDRISIQQQGS